MVLMSLHIPFPFRSQVPPCFSQPCQRGGTCHQDYGEATFTCERVPGREGELCEIGKKDPTVPYMIVTGENKTNGVSLSIR